MGFQIYESNPESLASKNEENILLFNLYFFKYFCGFWKWIDSNFHELEILKRLNIKKNEQLPTRSIRYQIKLQS